MSGFSTRMPELRYTWEGVDIVDYRNSGFTTPGALEHYATYRQSLQKQARQIRQQMAHVTDLGWTSWLDSDSDLKDRLAGLRKRYADDPEAYWNAAIQVIQKPYAEAQAVEAKAKARAAKKRYHEMQRHAIAGSFLEGMSDKDKAAFIGSGDWDKFFEKIDASDPAKAFSALNDWQRGQTQLPLTNDFKTQGRIGILGGPSVRSLNPLEQLYIVGTIAFDATLHWLANTHTNGDERWTQGTQWNDVWNNYGMEYDPLTGRVLNSSNSETPIYLEAYGEENPIFPNVPNYIFPDETNYEKENFDFYLAHLSEESQGDFEDLYEFDSYGALALYWPEVQDNILAEEYETDSEVNEVIDEDWWRKNPYAEEEEYFRWAGTALFNVLSEEDRTGLLEFLSFPPSAEMDEIEWRHLDVNAKQLLNVDAGAANDLLIGYVGARAIYEADPSEENLAMLRLSTQIIRAYASEHIKEHAWKPMEERKDFFRNIILANLSPDEWEEFNIRLNSLPSVNINSDKSIAEYQAAYDAFMEEFAAKAATNIGEAKDIKLPYDDIRLKKGVSDDIWENPEILLDESLYEEDTSAGKRAVGHVTGEIASFVITAYLGGLAFKALSPALRVAATAMGFTSMTWNAAVAAQQAGNIWAGVAAFGKDLLLEILEEPFEPGPDGLIPKLNLGDLIPKIDFAKASDLWGDTKALGKRIKNWATDQMNWGKSARPPFLTIDENGDAVTVCIAYMCQLGTPNDQGFMPESLSDKGAAIYNDMSTLVEEMEARIANGEEVPYPTQLKRLLMTWVGDESLSPEDEAKFWAWFTTNLRLENRDLIVQKLADNTLNASTVLKIYEKSALIPTEENLEMAAQYENLFGEAVAEVTAKFQGQNPTQFEVELALYKTLFAKFDANGSILAESAIAFAPKTMEYAFSMGGLEATPGLPWESSDFLGIIHWHPEMWAAARAGLYDDYPKTNLYSAPTLVPSAADFRGVNETVNANTILVRSLTPMGYGGFAIYIDGPLSEVNAKQYDQVISAIIRESQEDILRLYPEDTSLIRTGDDLGSISEEYNTMLSLEVLQVMSSREFPIRVYPLNPAAEWALRDVIGVEDLRIMYSGGETQFDQIFSTNFADDKRITWFNGEE